MPWQPQEPEALVRAQALMTSLRTRMATPALPATAASTTSNGSEAAPLMTTLQSTQQQQQQPAGAGGGGLATGTLPLFRGTGPFGLLTPQDVAKAVAELQVREGQGCQTPGSA